jgi:hypothetical protein
MTLLFVGEIWKFLSKRKQTGKKSFSGFKGWYGEKGAKGTWESL